MILIDINIWGRLHPLIVHFPLGLLVGVLLLESLNKWRNPKIDYRDLLYLGALFAWIAAGTGLVLMQSEDYTGELVAKHRWSGIISALSATLTAFIYYRRAQLPPGLPYLALWGNAIILSFTGHLGASITHGPDYLQEALSWNMDPKNTTALLEDFAQGDTLSTEQLDRLNLEVRALFAHHCYSCHSTGKRKGDLALDHKAGVFAGGENGPVIAVGNSGKSELIRRVKLPAGHDDAMPTKGKRLSDSEIRLIELWIDQGAHWAADTLKVFYEAPLALTKPDLPNPVNGFEHPIDRWISAYFEENNIKWPTLIDDRQFIRRAYLDILGLLPPSDSIRTFIASKDLHKRTRLIDQLLTDKENYALHWLSFWNDLLRNDYSGTGFITGGRKQITEWLYRAVYEQMPYDKMVHALVNPTPQSEGFINGIQWRGVVNASQRVELQAAQNISQSLLGLNLKCASCHNSFINNLTLDQAYGFANVFATEPLEIYRCDKPTGRMAQMAFLYPELGTIQSDSLNDRLAELAKILVQPENGRLYRTIVNRFWDRLFGRGIVAPVDEMDNKPWSQNLLDWLASDFIEKGYDFHYLLKLLMTSRAYQLPAVAYPSPDYLNNPDFSFRGPTLRRLTTEQFVDVFSQAISPMYHGVAYNPVKSEVDAKWIWHEEIQLDRRVLPTPGTRFLRKVFRLDPKKAVVGARLLITADQYFELFINGQKITEDGTWWKVNREQVPVDILSDNNIIAVKAKNEGVIPNPAGLLFQMELLYSDSSKVSIYSDPTWKTSADTSIVGWDGLQYDDSDWKNAWQAGSFEKSYWGQLLDFTFHPGEMHLDFARAAIVGQDDFMKTLGRPARENVVTKRDEEATLLQALMLTNSAFFHENIRLGAKKLIERSSGKQDQMIEKLYAAILGRSPSGKEYKMLRKKLNTGDEQEALEDIIWSLLLLPEFQFI